jgi:hypothetical protein|tara:strand:+ start:104 stop:355 length:252 start_codon:yes stop_codon:yes gene_type:complete
MLAPAPRPIPYLGTTGPTVPIPTTNYLGTAGPTVPVDTRTPQEKQKEELAKYGALIGLMGNVAGMIPGLKPLQYAGDVFNLIT